MSSGSFAFTAAYSFVGDTAVYMPSGEEGECRFRDFQHECVKEACPGQVNPNPNPNPKPGLILTPTLALTLIPTLPYLNPTLDQRCALERKQRCANSMMSTLNAESIETASTA